MNLPRTTIGTASNRSRDALGINSVMTTNKLHRRDKMWCLIVVPIDESESMAMFRHDDKN